MLGTESNGMSFCLMTAIYARKAKELERSGAAQFAMYAFYDAMERTALAVSQVLDAKRMPREAFDILTDYATRLEIELGELDGAGGDEVPRVDTSVREADEEHQPHVQQHGAAPDDADGHELRDDGQEVQEPDD